MLWGTWSSFAEVSKNWLLKKKLEWLVEEYKRRLGVNEQGMKGRAVIACVQAFKSV